LDTANLEVSGVLNLGQAKVGLPVNLIDRPSQ
jgi:hypothetical protein